MEKNDVMHGFRVTEVTDMPDQNGTMFEMVHEKTGAQLAWLQRNDTNKTFAIAFKTIPSDDTGVFHMLEHSVLNGSDRYPVREPFVELLKSSMQTFLNAMTYPDKTLYPVSSRNRKDFMNLMSVYLDAVFHPAIYQNPNIFYQEGWHYEIRKKEDMPVYKGVVLNEMKGAFSSVDETIIDTFDRILFPDNCYQYVSGGDPEHITDLTYEKFLETHKKFYHPSNARVFLDGDMDIDAVLAFINDEYFSHYEKEDMNFAIPMQKETDARCVKYEYESAEGEPTVERTQIAFGKIVSDYTQVEKNMAWAVLASVLVANNESPLKKNILDAGLGQDVELDLVDGIEQPWAVLNVRNTDPDKYDAIRKVLQDTARDLVKNGLDHEDILASINHMEFSYREKHEPAGVSYAQRSLTTWLYGGSPVTSLNLGSYFEQLRKKTEEGYFEKLLEEFLLDDAHLSSLIAVPNPKKAEERIAREEKKLADAKASWGEDIDQYIAINQKLDAWQKTPDSKEQLGTLPKLKLEDVERKPEEFKVKETEIHGVPVLVHEKEDSGIVYLGLYFDLAGVTREHLPSLALWSYLLTNLPTKKHSVKELNKLIKTCCGTLAFGVDAYSPRNEADSALPVFGVAASALKQNVSQMTDLILEILFETVYDKDLIRPLLKQDLEDCRQGLIMSGHASAVRRVSAHHSAAGLFSEYTSGYEAALWEKHLEENYEEKVPEFLEECAMYADVIFSKDRLFASISGAENKPLLERLIDSLHTIPANRARVHYPLLKEPAECIIIPAGISYAAAGASLIENGSAYDPKMKVLQHALTYDWLWNEVRVKGGAYGTGFSVNPNGNIAAYSYRDPDPMNALRAFKEAGKYASAKAEEKMDPEQMIIGTAAAVDPLLSPASLFRAADVSWLRGVTYEERCEARERILSVTSEDFGAFADDFAKTMENATVVIVGNEEALKKCGDLHLKKLEQL
jgi:Zn-dependent M16 (insulinase) family peptidase